MHALTIFTADLEQRRIVEAFLQALKIPYAETNATLEELEARLAPGQKKLWAGLKAALISVEHGEAHGSSWNSFKKELANGDIAA